MDATGHDNVCRQTGAPGRIMSRLAKFFVLLLPLLGLVAWSGNALAALKYSRASAGWTTNSTWSTAGCGGAANTTVPTNADDVTICAGNTVTMNGNAGAARSLTINGTANWTQARTTNVGGGGITIPAGGNITGASNGVLTSTGGLSINATLTSTTVTITLQTTNPQTISGTGSLGRLTVNSPVVATNTGNLTVTTRLTGSGNFTNGTNSQLHYNSTTTIGVTTLDATAAGNLVDYGAAGNQTLDIPATNTYYHLSLSGSGSKTIPAGTYTIAGDLTTNAGVTYNGTTNNPIINLAGNFSNSGTFNSGAGLFTFNGTAAQDIGGTSVTTFSNNLTIANTVAAVSASTSFNVNNVLTVNPGAVLSPVAAVVISDAGAGTITGAGTVQVTGTATADDFVSQYAFTTYTLTNLTVDYAGAAAQTISATDPTLGTPFTYGSATGGGLKISNASGVDLTAGSVTVGGTLTLASGTVTTGANTLITTKACNAPSVARTSGWVNGNLQKAIPAAASTCNFEVGDATNYTPASTTFIAGTTAGNLIASTVGTQHPSVTDPSFGLDTAKMVNRYWTLTNGGVGLPVGGYSATFNFINPGDLTAGANTANFEVENWSGAAWSATTVGTRNATSTQANSLTAFGAFAVGEKKPTIVLSINRLDTDPTSAATVRWTVTFSKSVSGVDATVFSLVPTGLSGTFITTVTGSGTSWIVTANTGIGSGTLRLDQTGAGSVVPTLTGTFTTGQFYTITATPALAEYRMDEARWNGTANEVADSSGNGNHAVAVNAASTNGGLATEAIPGNPGTCRYGVFDNGGTITNGYAQTPLPNLTSDFTVTAWMRSTNTATLGQRILVDDQSVSNGYGFSFSDAGTGVLRFYSRGIAPVILDSTYPIAANTWYFVAAVADITNKRRTIYVFNAAGTLLNSTSDAAAFTGTWGADAGPVMIGGTGALHFVGNLDEVRVYGKVLSQTALTAIATQTHACTTTVPDHYELSLPTSSVACLATTVTVTACADATSPCLNPSGAAFNTKANLATTGGALGIAQVTFGPAGIASTTLSYPAAADGVGVSVTLSDEQIVVAKPRQCCPDGASCVVANSCTTTFNTTGFIFSGAAGGGVATIPAQVAGTTSGTYYLRAVKTNTTTKACEPALAGANTVNFAYQCNNPAICSGIDLMSVNGGTATTIARNNNGSWASNTSVSMSFDANGNAPFTFNYSDVGQVTLQASKAAGGTLLSALTGTSNAFVTKPGGFVLSAIKRTSDSFANPAAVDAAGTKFVMAGEAFSVTVTATTSGGTTTPNYGQEVVAESVKLTSALVTGLGLTNNPALSGTFPAFTGGVATGTAFAWNEAGIIKLTPSIGDGDYLGAGDVSGTQSGNVGRFSAAKFALSGGAIANRTALTGCAAGCGTFTYMGEQMSAVLTLTAKALDGTTTLQNYNHSAIAANNFAKLDPTATGNPLALAAVDTGAPRTVATLDTTTYGIASGNFVLGAATVTAPFAVTRGGSASGPFEALDVGVNPADSDGAALATLDLAVNAGGTPNTHGKVGTTKARYGRMKLSSAYGSELLTLPINVMAQYWNGTSYVTNALDSNSKFAATAVLFGNYQNKLNATNYPNSGATVVTPASVVFANGVASYKLAGPGAGINGSVDMNVNALSAFLPSNTARATFGVYKGRNEFIYLREEY